MADLLPLIPLGTVGVVTWSLWAMRRMYGRAYRPFQGSFTTTTSVVVPAYNDDPRVLLRAITYYLATAVGDAILVVDHQDKLNIEHIQTSFPSSSHANARLLVTEAPANGLA